MSLCIFGGKIPYKEYGALAGKGEAYGSGFTEYRFYLRHEGKAK
jgi:hypothetical protein